MKRLKLFAFGSALALALAFAGCNKEVSNTELPNYTITVSDGISNGTVTADRTTAKKGATVTLIPIPDISYRFDSISVKDASNNDIATTEVAPGREYTFVMPESNVTVIVKFDYIFNEAMTALPAGTNGTAGTSGTYVHFGDWPQTIKADSVTVDESQSVTMGANTYYKGSDGAWYAKCTEKANGSGYKYSDGTDVAQASANSTKYFKVEPIKWRVLTDNYSGKKLLLAESILINCAYYDYYDDYYDIDRSIGGNTVHPHNYKESRVRAYLNGLSYTRKESDSADPVTDSSFLGKGFLQTAFTSTAQNQIADTAVDNSARSTNPNANASQWNGGSNGYACENTSDKIFLLSEQEVTNRDYGFEAYNATSSTGNSRIRKTTDYSKASGAYQNTTAVCGGWWWLRSPLYNKSSVAHCVSDYGSAYKPNSVDYDSAGVVPALSIN